MSNISAKAVLSYLLPPQEVIVKHDHSKLMCIGCITLAILCWYLWSWWWPRTVTLCGKFLQRKREGDDIFRVGDKTSWKHPAAQIWVISGLLSEKSWQICESFARLASSMAKQSPKINFTSWSFFTKVSLQEICLSVWLALFFYDHLLVVRPPKGNLYS